MQGSSTHSTTQSTVRTINYCLRAAVPAREAILIACVYKRQPCAKVRAQFLPSPPPQEVDGFDRPAGRLLQARRQPQPPLLAAAMVTLLRPMHDLSTAPLRALARDPFNLRVRELTLLVSRPQR